MTYQGESSDGGETQAWRDYLKEGVSLVAVNLPKPPVTMTAEDREYIALRLARMSDRDRAVMERCLRDHPGLTREEYMEMVVAYGF
jgi:hypothetical protein